MGFYIFFTNQIWMKFTIVITVVHFEAPCWGKSRLRAPSSHPSRGHCGEWCRP